MLAQLEKKSNFNSGRVEGFNTRARDEWVKERAKSVEPGMRVLDVGAGTAPYQDLFSHCEYKTQDFSQYEGYQGAGRQLCLHRLCLGYHEDTCGRRLLRCDLMHRGFGTRSRPIDALREMVRITKPGGGFS